MVSIPRPSLPGGAPPPPTTTCPNPSSRLQVTLPPVQPTVLPPVRDVADSLSDLSLTSNPPSRRPDDENKSFNESGTQTTHDSSEEERNTSPAAEDEDEPVTDGRRIVGQVRLFYVLQIR